MVTVSNIIPKKNDSREDGGNVMLMEARLCELMSSLRALARSNQDLKNALVESPDDTDFLNAIAENVAVINKQRKLAEALVKDMQRQGVSIALPEDIRFIDVNEQPTETGIYL
eukprot:CAMPEP_0195527768 /NCGR_PEP_ID=MMETSP0794_2-20130614/29684_1 /TAXON_ID=515487 /ORGANISM="Stephanopyxis turris, Strain CCMP 815" /LENGTH=112 /DNA_ID=CAMNT_0040658761 /DNA_START=79 /DNA_END=417 /DNA_ORIENTATION=+